MTHRSPQSLLSQNVAGHREAAAVRRNHGTDLGSAQRRICWSPTRDPARRSRRAAACRGAALRPEDVDFIRGVVSPAIQWPNEPLKSETSKTPIPIPNELSLELSAAVARGRGLTLVTAEDGRPIAGPWAIERAVRDARAKVEGLQASSGFTTFGTTSRRC
jgi:hypothetical protein